MFRSRNRSPDCLRKARSDHRRPRARRPRNQPLGGITERKAAQIVNDLEEAGYVTKTRNGPSQSLRRPRGGNAPGSATQTPRRRRSHRTLPHAELEAASNRRYALSKSRASRTDHARARAEGVASPNFVAIAGNAVENTTGVVLARKGDADLAISVVNYSVARIAVFLFPALVLVRFSSRRRSRSRSRGSC